MTDRNVEKIWVLSVEIPVDAEISPTTILGHNVFALQGDIEEAIGKKSWSSGCGFGYRDFQIRFETEGKAKRAAEIATKILRKAGYEIRFNGDDTISASISIFEMEEE